jgi:uncharacterized protein
MSAADEIASETWDPWCQSHETHSGAVVLLGDLAFKVKKPIALAFLDFRDREDRRRVCATEVELNRRLAPDVYLGVGELTPPGGPAEPVIVMRRLPDRLRLSHLARNGRPIEDDVRRVARLVAAFHSGARTGSDIDRQGTRDALRRRWDANLEQAAAIPSSLDRTALDEIALLAHQFLDGRSDLFDDRIPRGAIVDGHGDLTPDDIYCLPDGPRLLDCLEFDDTLRYLDRLDDVAFLAMGLEDLGADAAASALLETWAECVGDPAPPALVHHFIAYRAFGRAKVGSLRGAQGHGPAGRQPSSGTSRPRLPISAPGRSSWCSSAGRRPRARRLCRARSPTGSGWSSSPAIAFARSSPVSTRGPAPRPSSGPASTAPRPAVRPTTRSWTAQSSC